MKNLNSPNRNIINEENKTEEKKVAESKQQTMLCLQASDTEIKVSPCTKSLKEIVTMYTTIRISDKSKEVVNVSKILFVVAL